MTVNTVDVAAALERMRVRFSAATSDTDLELETLLPWQSETLSMAAIAPRLDRDAVNDILRLAITGIPEGTDLFAWLAASEDVELIDGENPTVTVRDRSNRALASISSSYEISKSMSDVERVRRFALQLGNYFAERSADWQLDAVSLLIIADTARALRIAKQMYREAEISTDFTRRFQVLQVLEERKDLLQRAVDAWHPPMVVDPLVEEYRTFLTEVGELRRMYDAARTFASDFERTTQMFERKIMRDAWSWLSRKDSPIATQKVASTETVASNIDEQWILNIEAQGGAGKTMFLRWLSARRCIQNNVPYARLDFDFVEQRLTEVAPWYLVALCARTLDSQLEGRPLREIVARAEEIVPFDSFSLGAKHVSRSLELLKSDRTREDGTAIVGQIARALMASSAPTIVLVLDTLEEVLINQEASLPRTLNALKDLHRQCPKLRVVLSGRFSLSARIPEFEKEFGPEALKLELGRLSSKESSEYLTVTRGMPSGAVVDAIVARSAGLPMSLSLYADEWQLNPHITVEEVNAIPGPELHYLVERVLKRVPSQIAWLLRYGVAARQLTRTFLADVIVPELEELRTGNSVDNPLLDTEAVRRYFDVTRLAQGQEVLSADLLWEDLERYASTFSFISRDRERPDCLVIHSEVLVPMRRELQKQPVLLHLNRRAMQLAELRAGQLNAANANDWGEERAAALYHALRISDSEAHRVWTSSITDARKFQAFDAEIKIANEASSESPEVSMEFKILGAGERTAALLSLASLQTSDSKEQRYKARKSWESWRELLNSAGRKPDAAFHILGVRSLAKDGRVDPKGLRVLETALSSTSEPGERLDLLYALVEGSIYRPSALQYISMTRDILATEKGIWSDEVIVQFNLTACDELVRQGKYDVALPIAREAAALGENLDTRTAINTSTWELFIATTCKEMDVVAAAQRRIRGIDAQIDIAGNESDEVGDARVAFRTESIRAFTFGAELPVGIRPHYRNSHDSLGTDTCNEALLFKLDMRPAEALSLLQTARASVNYTSNIAAMSLTHQAATAIFLLGDNRRLHELLNEMSSLALPESSSWWVDFQFRSCINQCAWAMESLLKLRDFNKRRPTVTAILMQQIAELVLIPDHSRASSEDIVRTLETITPVEARRHLFFEVIFNTRHLTVHPDVRGKLATALEMQELPAELAKSDAVAVSLQEWMLRKWIATESVKNLPPLVVRNALDLSKWYCDTERRGKFVGLTDAMLDAPDVSDFARGIALLASASHEQESGNIEKALVQAQRSHDLLTSPSIPPSIWLARANLLIYRLKDIANSDNEALLLSVEELCERLDAQFELAAVRDLISLRKIGQQLKFKESSVLSLDANVQSIAGITNPITRIADIVRTDASRVATNRTPGLLITALSNEFFNYVTDLTNLVPPPTKDSAVDLRYAVISDHPTIAALPIELAITSTELRDRYVGRFNFLPGWRSVEPLHQSVNERWAFRALNSLGVKSSTSSSDLSALAASFQEQHKLPVTGELDAGTLRPLINALRGDSGTRVALVTATTQPWATASTEMLKRIYGENNARSVVLGQGSADTLRALRAEQFDIIHILAPLVETASIGGLAFHLRPSSRRGNEINSYAGDRASGEGSPYLSLSDLISTIRRPDSLLRPVVIVHNTLEDMPLEESIRQYCLRNIVCMELNRSGAPVASVGISTALFAGGKSPATELVAVLTAGEPLIQFLNRVGVREPSRVNATAAERVTSRSAQSVVFELQTFGSVVYATNPEYVVV